MATFQPEVPRDEDEQFPCSLPNWDHKTYSKDPEVAHQQYLHLLDEHSDDYD